MLFRSGRSQVHRINFHLDGQDYYQAIEHDHNIQVIPDHPERPGTRFVGWNTDHDGNGAYVDYSTVIDEDVELFALYRPSAANISYKANGNGSIEITDETVEFLEDDSAPRGNKATPQENVKFISWTDDEKGIAVSEDPEFIPEITLAADELEAPEAEQPVKGPVSFFKKMFRMGGEQPQKADVSMNAKPVDVVYTANFAAMPEKHFASDEGSDVDVIIDAPAGAFADGTKMVVGDADADAAKAAV